MKTRAGAMLGILKGRSRPRVWTMPRLWVADRTAVRLSLPWHGPASWDDMHSYVMRVITDNTVPSPDYIPQRDNQADQLARSILLSVCHRLNIEPVGAFVYHDPDYEEETTPDCPSCQHELDIHSDDGCWYTVGSGRLERNSVCPCAMTSQEIEGGIDNE